MQDWLTVIIVILIVGVLADGFRRMRAHRRETLRMSRRVANEDGNYGDIEEDLTSSEFPGGGPRVVGVRDTSDLANVNQNLRQSYVASKMTRGAPKRSPVGEPAKAEPVPSAGSDTASEQSAEQEREPVLGSLDNLDDDYDTAPAGDVRSRDSAAEDDIIQSSPYQPLGSDEADVDDNVDVKPEPIAEVNTRPEQDRQPREPVAGADPEPQSKPKPEPKSKAPEKPAAQANEERETAPREAPDEVLVINVMARRGAMFAGPELLDAMLAQGLRFGDMDIFHRHETSDGHGKILFSVANMVVPGTFALEDMDSFESPGISMFLSLPISGDSLAAYNLMAQSAQNIAQMLGGELKDENRSVMTRQTIEHGRQRVLEYERKRRLAKV